MRLFYMFKGWAEKNTTYGSGVTVLPRVVGRNPGSDDLYIQPRLDWSLERMRKRHLKKPLLVSKTILIFPMQALLQRCFYGI
jgi:hypothetical protein